MMRSAAAFLLVTWHLTAVWAQGLVDRDNRFEGLLRVPISGTDRPALDLVSFVGFFEPFQDRVILRVRFFLPAPYTHAKIVAQELTPDRFYRMESKPSEWTTDAWSVFSPWPASDVIIAEKVRPTNIGVVVSVEDATSGAAFVAPAFVEHSGAAKLWRYTAQLRPVRTTLSAVDYRLERVAPQGLALVKSDTMAVERPEQRPFRIELDASALADGRFRLTVVGHVKNNSTLKVTRQYDFEHRRLPG
jgi:hypothetical protein